jgi:hypothetical protein
VVPALGYPSKEVSLILNSFSYASDADLINASAASS